MTDIIFGLFCKTVPFLLQAEHNGSAHMHRCRRVTLHTLFSIDFPYKIDADYITQLGFGSTCVVSCQLFA